MKRTFGILVAAALVAATSAGQITRTYSSPGIVPVPPSGTGGQAGGAANPANVATVVVNGTDSLRVGDIEVYLYLAHPRAGDLLISLSHCGTSINLFPTSQNPAASFNGNYLFSDSAVTPITTAVNQAPGTVPPAPYKPAQPLSAFNGHDMAGPWTLSVADLALGFSGTVGNVAIQNTTGSLYGGWISPGVPIPDGQNGIPGQPVTRVLNVPPGGNIGTMEVSLHLTHTYTSDLTITLSHGGVNATIMSHNTPVSGANLQGAYFFSDEAPISWTEAVGALSGSEYVVNGSYRPLSPLTAFRGLNQAGPWYLTVCDSGTGDTGTLAGFHMTIVPTDWNLSISQPNGAAFVTLTNKGGATGNGYANLVTFAPGAFPNGWLYGLDIAMEDVAYQVSFGPPFFGTLDACGGASTTVLGPVPHDVTCYLTSLELDPSGSVVNVKPAFVYTTP